MSTAPGTMAVPFASARGPTLFDGCVFGRIGLDISHINFRLFRVG